MSVSKHMKNRQGERADKRWTRQQKWELVMDQQHRAGISLTLYLYLPHTSDMLGLWSLQYFTSKQGVLGLTLEQEGMVVAAIVGFE